jgi:hypothetical protein
LFTEEEFHKTYPGRGVPARLTPEWLDTFGGDILLEGPQATSGVAGQQSIRDGVQEINGKWYTKYSLGPVPDDKQ